MDFRELSVTALASSTAGMLARFPLHPLDTCKAKIQTQTTAEGFLSVFAKTFRTEGVRGLFRGLSISMIGAIPAGCIYFTSYELSKKVFGHENAPATHFASGFVAESHSCVFWVPIDVIKERLQVQSTFAQRGYNYKGPLDAIFSIARDEGLFRGIYRGYGATLMSFGPFSAFYLMFYEQAKLFWKFQLQVSEDKEMPLWAFAVGAGFSGAVASFITNGLDMAKLRIQVQRASAVKVFPYRNVFHGVYCIARDEGLKGLFKGAGARMCFHAPATALTITLYEKLKIVYDRVL